MLHTKFYLLARFLHSDMGICWISFCNSPENNQHVVCTPLSVKAVKAYMMLKSNLLAAQQGKNSSWCFKYLLRKMTNWYCIHKVITWYFMTHCMLLVLKLLKVVLTRRKNHLKLFKTSSRYYLNAAKRERKIKLQKKSWCHRVLISLNNLNTWKVPGKLKPLRFF